MLLLQTNHRAEYEEYQKVNYRQNSRKCQDFIYIFFCEDSFFFVIVAQN